MRMQESGKHFVLYYMLGFFAGIMYANLLAKDYIASMGILNEFFLNQYSADDINTAEYLWYVTRIRVFPALILGAFGCSYVRKGAVAAFLLWTGFSSGLCFTLRGILLCFGTFMSIPGSTGISRRQSFFFCSLRWESCWSAT